MFVDTFIKRPILASVCSLVLILAGAIAIPTMPVAQYPPLAPPVITVTAIYTGANAQEVETSVTTPIRLSTSPACPTAPPTGPPTASEPTKVHAIRV